MYTYSKIVTPSSITLLSLLTHIDSLKENGSLTPKEIPLAVRLKLVVRLKNEEARSELPLLKSATEVNATSVSTTTSFRR